MHMWDFFDNDGHIENFFIVGVFKFGKSHISVRKFFNLCAKDLDAVSHFLKDKSAFTLFAKTLALNMFQFNECDFFLQVPDITKIKKSAEADETLQNC